MANAKKLVAFILSAVLLLSVLVVPGMFTFAEKDGDTDLDIWNGQAADSFADGSAGTEDDPILVATPEELALVISSGGKGLHYQLTADMYLNDVSESDWYNNADNNAWYANGDFNGHINGAGNIIYGLWYPTTQTGVVGLVPQQTNKDASLSIKNLGIRCARVYSSDSHAGGFLGNSCAQYGITIENCFIDETANIHGGNRSAGFVANIERKGSIVKLDILNCYTKAVVDNVNDNSCGFLGQGYNATFTIRNSYSYGEKIYHSTSSNRNTLSTEEAPFANLYATVACTGWAAGVGTVVSEVNMLGEAAKTNMPGLDYEGVWYVQDGKTPVLRLFKDKLIEPEAPVVGEDGVWNGNIATAFEDDSAGTEEDPIEIRNPGELARAINLGSGHYKLVADMYLNNVSASNWYENEDNNAWFADKNFTGSINGDGHIIYGLWYPTTQTGTVGLISKVTDKNASLTIKNLGIRYARIYSSDSHAAGFLGESCGQYGITIENCFIDETATIHGGYRSAGFVGSISRSGDIVKLDINNCYTKAVVDDVNDNSCGFLGQGYNATFTIKNSYCYGERIYHSTSSNRNTLSSDPAPFENLYTTVKGTSWAAGVGIVVGAEDIVGLNARAVMAGLDFEGVWLAAKDQTPVLRQFAGKLGAVEDSSKPVEENGIWTGEMSVSFADKSAGTEEDPILIQNAGELAFAIASGGGGKYYKLTKDIYLNDVSAENWASKSTNNVWINASDFCGTIDGAGNIIYGLWSPEGYENNIGLISNTTQNSTLVSIKNLGIRHAYIRSTNKAGAFIGYNVAQKALFEKCFVDDTVYIAANGYAGGFVGQSARGSGVANELYLNNCYSAATAVFTGVLNDKKDCWQGAILGRATYTKFNVTNSYVIGKVYFANGKGTTTQYNRDGEGNVVESVTDTWKNCYVTDKASGTWYEAGTAVGLAAIQGVNAKTTLIGFDFDTVWETKARSTPVLKQFASKIEEAPKDQPTEDANGIWNGNISTYFDDESAGTEEDPVLIKSAGELALAIKSGGGGKYYQLTKDIYLNDVSDKGWVLNRSGKNNVWLTDCKFSGTLDGNGNIVYGVWYPETTTAHIGFIPQVDGATVKNLGVRYSHIVTTGKAGGIVGYNESAEMLTVENCFVDETVTVTGDNAGGMIGYSVRKLSINQVTIKNCYSKAKLTGNKIGHMFGQAYNCTWTADGFYGFGAQLFFADGAARVSLSTLDASEIYKNLYSDVAGTSWAANKWTQVAKADMYGEAAKNSMPGLFGTSSGSSGGGSWWEDLFGGLFPGSGSGSSTPSVWVTVDEGTPILKIFEGKIDGKDIDVTLDSIMYESGTGTKDDPYVIKTVEQFRYLAESDSTAGKYYVLANDIYINDTTNPNWKETAQAWYVDNISARFAGYLEGNGYAIHGIYVNQTPVQTRDELNVNNVTGLFNYVEGGATIRNLHLRDSYISGKGYVGGIVGRTHGDGSVPVTIQGCSTDESVQIRGFDVGGIVAVIPNGSGAPVNLSFSYVSSDIIGYGDYVGGLFGESYLWPPSNYIYNCYMTSGKATRDNRANVKDSQCVYGTVATDTMYFNTDVVKLEDMYGDNARNTMYGLIWDDVWYTEEGKTPQLKVVPEGINPIKNDQGVVGRVWMGFFASEYAGGTGTQEDPYIIETPEQLALLCRNGGSTKDTYYKITADIKLNDTSKPNWEKTAKQWFVNNNLFVGKLDGGYHVITGLYFNTSDGVHCGLFGGMSEHGVIEKLGIDYSYISNEAKDKSLTYAAAFVGLIHNYDGDGSADKQWTGSMENAPLFSECFVGPNVTIKGNTVGGFAAGGGAGVRIYDCYSVPVIPSYTYRGGAFLGDFWQGYESYIHMKNCYGSTPDREQIGGGGTKYQEPIGHSKYENVYVDGMPNDKITVVASSLYGMQDERAKNIMKGFDFTNVWKTVKKGTPVLRGFENADKYSNKREAPKVEIKFVTGTGASQHESIYGYPLGTAVDVSTFPVPTRYGYQFEGWHMFETGDYEVNLATFPNFDCEVYAKWSLVGFTQGFEGEINKDYDVNGGADYYQPGMAGYNPRYIHSGLRSMHVLPDSAEAPMFLIGYDYMLEVGQQYDINFWMCSKENGASGQIEILHALYGDVNDDIVGSEIGLEFTGLTSGQWTQYRITFTANAPYLIFRTTPGVELFFDDIHVVPLGEAGEVGQIDGFNPGALNGEPQGVVDTIKQFALSLLELGAIGIIIILVLLLLFLVLFALIVVLVIVLIRKKVRAKKAAAAAAVAPAPDTPEVETPSAEE